MSYRIPAMLESRPRLSFLRRLWASGRTSFVVLATLAIVVACGTPPKTIVDSAGMACTAIALVADPALAPVCTDLQEIGDTIAALSSAGQPHALADVHRHLHKRGAK